MVRSHFCRQVPAAVERWWDTLGSSASSDASDLHSSGGVPPSRFVRIMPVPPSGFQVDYPLETDLPLQTRPVSPVQLNAFLARVEDRIGTLLPLTLWELPSWRRLESVLELNDLKEGELEPLQEPPLEPLTGDLLQIWTWTDLTEDGPVDRMYVRIHRRTLDEADRLRAAQALEALRAERRGEPEGESA